MEDSTTSQTTTLPPAYVSLFDGTTKTAPVERLPLADVLGRIRDGTYRPFVEGLRTFRPDYGEEWYKDEKKRSMSFTPAGTFSQRANAKLISPTGLVHFDFDHPPHLADTKARLMSDPYIVYAFTSPSGDGLKVAVWTEGIADDKGYKHAWGTVLAYFQQTYPDLAVANDDHCKDISRLCFMSWDPALYCNPEARLFVVPPYQPPAPKPTPSPQPTRTPLPADRQQRYAQQALTTATEMIDASVPPTATSAGTRHATRLKASRLLGGYVAGGILSYAEAFAALEAAVARNTEDLATSMKTIEDGLRYGEQDAITLAQLEQERQDWLQAHRATLSVQQNGTTPPPAPSSPESSPPSLSGTPEQQTPAPRPDILLNTEITRIVDEGQAALLAMPGAPLVFQRARRLSVIAHGVKPPTWLQRPADMPVIAEAAPAYLQELANQAANWWRWDKRQKKWDLVQPPGSFTAFLLGRPMWKFPPLEGIVCSPTLRPDGSVLDTPGYDESTGLFVDFNRATFPPLPQRPTLDDARSAIGTLQEVVQNFPFAKDCHRSAWLSGVLSLVCRFAIRGPVPLHGITATAAGSGKTLLADTLAIIGTGHHAPHWSQVQDPEEERKRLFTLALAGDPLVVIDNVTRPLGSPALANYLTAISVKERLLGSLEERAAPAYAVMLATGNNLMYVHDVGRRVVPIALDARMEKPEERTDFIQPNLPAWVQQERSRLVIAALTIVKAYFNAGCPPQSLSAMGSFKEWSDLVRQSLVWAGEPDPCEGRKEIEEDTNPEYEQLAVLLQAWETCYPIPQGQTHTPVKTLNEVIADIEALRVKDKPFILPGTPNVPNEFDALQDALGTLDQYYDGKGLRRDPISNKLRVFQGRPIGQRRLSTRGKDRTNKTLWIVEALRGTA